VTSISVNNSSSSPIRYRDLKVGWIYEYDGADSFYNYFNQNLMQAAVAKVVIYAEDYCPYCIKVKDIFTGLKVPFDWKPRSANQAEVMVPIDSLVQSTQHKVQP
jgi:hypothetical protein